MPRLSYSKWRLSVLHLNLPPLTVTDCKCADQQKLCFCHWIEKHLPGNSPSTMQGKLRWGIYVKEEGQRFWKKIDANGQFINTLPQNLTADSISTFPSPTEKPELSSRRPHKMMHGSSYIWVSELIEQVWNSCWSIFFSLWVWGEGEAPLWVASVHEHHHINCQYVMRPW